MARLKLSECLARMIPEPGGEGWEFVESFIADNRTFSRAVKDALRANGLSLDRPEEFRLCYDGCHEYALYRERRSEKIGCVVLDMEAGTVHIPDGVNLFRVMPMGNRVMLKNGDKVAHRVHLFVEKNGK